MYCSKCGKQIADDVKFCSYCGSSVNGQTGASVKTSSNQVASLLQEKKWTLWGAVLGCIVSLFLLGAEMFEITYTAFWSNTESFTMFGDKAFFKFLFIVGYIVAAGVMVLPMIREEEWTDWNFWPAVGLPVVSLIVLFFVIIVMKSKVSSDELMEAIKATVKVSTKGWVFILSNIATCVLAFKAGSDIGEMQEAAHKAEVSAVWQKQVCWCARCGEEISLDGACPKCGSTSRIFSKKDRDRMFGEKNQ